MSSIMNLNLGNKHFSLIAGLVVTILIAVLAGCGTLPVFPTKSDYENPENSIAFLYIKVDDTSWTPTFVYLRKPEGGRAIILSWLDNGSKKAGDCYLYAGAIPGGKYEFDELPGADGNSYVFPKDTKGNYVLKVGKPDVHNLGQYALHTSKAAGAFSSGAFTFDHAAGCPGDKAAYKAILNITKSNSIWKDWIDGTRWHAILVKKSS